jgi:hypothetical protein
MDVFENYVIVNTVNALGVNGILPEHRNYIITLLRKLDMRQFKNVEKRHLGQILGKYMAKKLRDKIKEDMKQGQFDLHEYQKKALGSADEDPAAVRELKSDTTTEIAAPVKSLIVGDFLGVEKLNEFKMLFNPESMHTYQYLLMDTNFRDTTTEIPTDITSFRWKYAPTQFIGQGFCNSVGVIQNIIAIKLYQLRIPYLATMNTDAKRVSVLIEEFAAQAFIGENGRRFHFMTRPNFITGQTDIELSTEDYNDNIFHFRKPIKTLDSITVSFGNPLTLLRFSTPFNRFFIALEFICLKDI